MPKVLVVTLLNGEKEYELCRQKIADQKLVDIDHRVIEGLNWYQAHAYISQLWNKVRADYDLMAKIDADSILNSSRALKTVLDTIHENGASGAHIRMKDLYSGSLIYGMNF